MDFVDHPFRFAIEREGRAYAIEFMARFTVGKISPDLLRLDRAPNLIDPSLTRTQLKLIEADCFLQLLKANRHSEPATLFHLDAFLSALRSITWTLQKECNSHPDFAPWYEARQAEMRSSPLLSRMVQLRNEAVKEGLDSPQVWFRVKVYDGDDGNTSGGIEFQMSLGGLEFHDPTAACGQALSELGRIVVEAVQKGFLKSDAKRRALLWTASVHRQVEGGQWRRLGAGPESPLEATNAPKRLAVPLDLKVTRLPATEVPQGTERQATNLGG